MNRCSTPTLVITACTWLAFAITAGISGLQSSGQASAQEESVANENVPIAETNKAQDRPKIALPTVDEARARAKILHEAFHGALQVMHRDFFREEEKFELPANSLEDVFKKMASDHNIELRWMAVETKAMSIKHKPKTDFEHAAVKALASGSNGFESVEPGTYRYAGSIRLSAHCLKCHAPSRSSNDERISGLIISMPLKQK